MTQEPLVGQEWLDSLKPLSEEQKQENQKEALKIKEWQQKCNGSQGNERASRKL